jgi:hypothetical protein
MSVRPDGPVAPSPVSRVLTSVPWVVVLLGVALLVTLLMVVVFSLRAPERQAAAPEPAPPMYLPTVGTVTTSAAPTDAPLVAVDGTRSPTPSASGSPSVTPGPTRSAGSATPAPVSSRSGTLTARYQATSSDRDSFTARLTVTNGSARSQDWRVELLFTGNVKGIQASSAAGVSVTSQGNGWYVLRSTAPLGSGASSVVQLSFTRTGSGDRPGQCTVNGVACAIG